MTKTQSFRLAAPDTLLMLGQIAGAINEYFKLPKKQRINELTPYIWWDRSKRNRDISLPMPHPALVVGEGRSGRSFWTQEAILHWYGAWKGIEVPRGIAAGDRVDGRGREYPSEYRA